jgi:uncharacterized membrane protein
MTPANLLQFDFGALGLTQVDVLALAWFVACTVGYNLIAGSGPLWRTSLVGAIQGQRMRWMANMAQRNDRVIDVLLISNLATGNSFFASTSIIILGALSAVLGSGDHMQAILERLPFTAHANSVAWDVKIILLIVVFIYAFFKFAWAFRLAHYSMIMMGATPSVTSSTPELRELHAARAGRIAGIAAEHSNLGLRSYYFGMAAIGWFFHPLAFIATTTLVMLIVTRREFFSRTLSILSDQRTRTISTSPPI